MYLGLPAFTLRQKRLQFGYIRDKIQKKLLGWNQREFSAGGKEVLLKAVIQAIPTYAMQCFRIPEAVCADIDRLSAGFWWGDKDEGKRMHWARWERLCRPKTNGGLGFRDIRSFNKALLAKQLWRMVNNPSSLIARVFGAKYCKGSDLLSAPVRPDASFVWRSIAWSRDVVKRGLVWGVGNGVDISVVEDSWVVGLEGSLRDFGEVAVEAGRAVSGLLEDGRRWDEAKVRRCFSPFVQSCIFNTPIGEAGKREERRWKFDEKGRFSVKSAYLVEIGFYDSHANASDPDRKSWSRLVWSVPIPPKARVFLWRAFNDIIPTSANLKAHHVPSTGVCHLCGDRWASTEHSLLYCPRIVRTWKDSRFWGVVKRANGLNIIDIATAVRGEWGEELYALWAVLLWQVWVLVCRCMHPHSGEAILVSEASCVGLLEAFQAARPTMMREDSLGVILGEKKWSKPRRGAVCVDVDAHFDPSSQRYGVGVVIRDDEGRLVAALSKPTRASSSPMMAEIMAVVHGLVFCTEEEVVAVELFTDSFLAARVMADPEDENNLLPNDICDILDVARVNCLLGVFHMYRSAILLLMLLLFELRLVRV